MRRSRPAPGFLRAGKATPRPRPGHAPLARQVGPRPGKPAGPRCTATSGAYTPAPRAPSPAFWPGISLGTRCSPRGAPSGQDTWTRGSSASPRATPPEPHGLVFPAHARTSAGTLKRVQVPAAASHARPHALTAGFLPTQTSSPSRHALCPFPLNGHAGHRGHLRRPHTTRLPATEGRHIGSRPGLWALRSHPRGGCSASPSGASPATRNLTLWLPNPTPKATGRNSPTTTRT